jgi:hypothetical protein
MNQNLIQKIDEQKINKIIIYNIILWIIKMTIILQIQ